MSKGPTFKTIEGISVHGIVSRQRLEEKQSRSLASTTGYRILGPRLSESRFGPSNNAGVTDNQPWKLSGWLPPSFGGVSVPELVTVSPCYRIFIRFLGVSTLVGDLISSLPPRHSNLAASFRAGNTLFWGFFIALVTSYCGEK
jgi:hypothetical protein